MDYKKAEKAVKALKNDVHNEDGWLSDAQHAQLEIDGDNVRFLGEGSIDLMHLIEIVLRAADN